MRIGAVLFDADGVVITPPFRFAAYLEREHGLTQAHTGSFFAGPFEACLVGRADLKEALPPYLAAWGWTHTLEEFLARWFDEENAPDRRLLAAIEGLRVQGIRCGLATCQERYRSEYMRAVMGFDRLFDDLFFSAEVGYMKPDAHFYRHIERALGLPGEAILFWDDAQANVDAARACGWQAERYIGLKAFQRRIGAYVSAGRAARPPEE